MVLCCDPDEGGLWVSDLAADTVYVIVSRRTEQNRTCIDALRVARAQASLPAFAQ